MRTPQRKLRATIRLSHHLLASALFLPVAFGTGAGFVPGWGFEENHGQAPATVKFVARRPSGTLQLSPSSVTLRAHSAPGGSGALGALTLRLSGARPEPVIEGSEPLPGKVHYFLGSDPSQWRRDVVLFGVVRCREVYPGIDWIHYGQSEGLEFDFLVAPRADPERIRLSFEGAKAIEINRDGALLIHFAGATARLRAPSIYQCQEGSSRLTPVSGNYVVRGGVEAGFEVGRYNVEAPLLIDPALEYSTFLGGGSEEGAHGIAVDAAGAAYFTGWTQSGPNADRGDAFVVKVNPAGNRFDYTIIYGGTDLDQALGIAVDAAGNAYMVGHTASTDFPVANAIQSELRGTSDLFVCKLSATADRFLYSTYLGGDDAELATFLPTIVQGGAAIDIDNAGHAYVAGMTSSQNFPVTAGAIQRQLADTDPFAPRADGFVAKLAPAGNQLVYSTYLGGAGRDRPMALVVDGLGQAIVAGATASSNFPTANAPNPARLLSGDVGFVSRLNPAGTALSFSTYLTGAREVNAMALDDAGAMYLAGAAQRGLPTTPGAFQRRPHTSGNLDAFIMKLTPAGDAVAYSTYLGGFGEETAWAIAVHGREAVAVGSSRSKPEPEFPDRGFPLRQAIVTNYYGLDEEAFIIKLDEAGDAVYSTLLGGAFDDVARAVAIDSAGSVYVTGDTTSTDFPLRNPIQPGIVGQETFIAKVSHAAGEVVTLLDPDAWAFPYRFYRARLLQNP